MLKPITPPGGSRPLPVEVRDLRKVYRDIAAVDGISFGLRYGHGAARRQRRRQDHHHLHADGTGGADLGEARVFGADMARERHQVLHRMNFESPYVDVPMRLTVRQNLEVFGRLYGVRDLKATVARTADDLRLADLLDRPYGKLSAGQRTRVSLAKALLNTPELLLLDEPTASLDPDTADWVRSRLEAYRAAEGATIVLASHNMTEVERLADRVIMLEKGRIIADETPAGLIKSFGRANLEEVFLAIARRGTGEEGSAP